MPSGRFYDRQVWRKHLRVEQLARQPICEHCFSAGIYTAAAHVDHIKRISEGGDPFDFNNFASLCASCHSKKTAIDKGGKQKAAFDLNGNPANGTGHWERPS